MLYFAVCIMIAPEDSKDINLYFPTIVGSILFIIILMKDASWVEKKKNELEAL